MESVWIVTFDPGMDCCHKTNVMICSTEEKAKSFVEKKGKYSDYDYEEVKLDQLGNSY